MGATLISRVGQVHLWTGMKVLSSRANAFSIVQIATSDAKVTGPRSGNMRASGEFSSFIYHYSEISNATPSSIEEV